MPHAFLARLCIVNKLLEIHPDLVKLADDVGNLPLHLAFRAGQSEDVISLLSKSYPEGMTVVNQSGKTPIQCADRSPAPDRALVTYVKHVVQVEKSAHEEQLRALEESFKMEHHQDVASMKKEYDEEISKLKEDFHLAVQKIKEQREKEIAEAQMQSPVRMVSPRNPTEASPVDDGESVVNPSAPVHDEPLQAQITTAEARPSNALKKKKSRFGKLFKRENTSTPEKGCNESRDCTNARDVGKDPRSESIEQRVES